MKVVIRADASNKIGAGHLMRCLNLASYFKQLGHKIVFVCRALPGNLTAFLVEQQFDVQILQSSDSFISQPLTQYEKMLGVSWQQDCSDFNKQVKKADLVIVDHYALGEGWETSVSRHFNCPIVVIDDLKRKHVCSLIVDQTLSRQPHDYHESSSLAVLTGTQYALLSAIMTKHSNPITLENLTFPLRILITFGASDEPNGTLKVLQTLVSSKIEFKATVLLRPEAKNYQSVKTFAKQFKYISHINHIENMAEMMENHDIAIGAGGSTCWERACVGLPSIVIPIADNQRDICQALVDKQVAIKLELDEIQDLLIDSIDSLKLHYDDFKFRGKEICDGLGVPRVYDRIMELMN